jgi:hypothetical protein
MLETVFALLMIIDHEIKEHRIQSSLSDCLAHKRVAERTSKGKAVQYKCIKSEVEIEVNVDGSKTIKKLILE